MTNVWREYWNSLLDQKKLRNVIEKMNEYDGGVAKTESICHDIYDQYSVFSSDLEKIKDNLIKYLETMPGVHLHTSRVKALDSILQKVIVKRSEWITDARSPYFSISGQNYRQVLGDLVGVRIIVSYRGDWKQLHHQIVSKFPYKDMDNYSKKKFIPHEKNKQFIAEIPKAYYAYGDDLSMYENEFVECKLHEKGYRSVHYVLSYEDTYVELQLRTIYDEAWSDCDHRYVYKQEDNISYQALLVISEILNGFTNAANDLGEEMRCIFESEPVIFKDTNTYETSTMVIERMDKIYQRFDKTAKQYHDFKSKLKPKEGE